MRPDFARFRVLVPFPLVDRLQHLLGQVDRASTSRAVNGRGNTGLNADHEVVQFVQNRVPRLQLQRFATQPCY